jgi:hypothetical protein
MNPIETLGLALGAGFSSGLNLYATVATLGLLQRFGVLHLPPGLQVLSHPWVLAIAITLYLLEFFADKIPYFDTFWDALHTFIRPPAAALLTFAAAGGAPPEWRWGAALLAGGVALTSHGTKPSPRAAVNTTPFLNSYFTYAASQSKNVLYQNCEFCGFNTQCPSSGNTTSFDGTPCRCSALKNSRDCVYGTR